MTKASPRDGELASAQHDAGKTTQNKKGSSQLFGRDTGTVMGDGNPVLQEPQSSIQVFCPTRKKTTVFLTACAVVRVYFSYIALKGGVSLHFVCFPLFPL